jgi:hypothetical protein
MAKAKEKVVLRTKPLTILPLHEETLDVLRALGHAELVVTFEGDTIAEACQRFIDTAREFEALTGIELRLEGGE